MPPNRPTDGQGGLKACSCGVLNHQVTNSSTNLIVDHSTEHLLPQQSLTLHTGTEPAGQLSEKSGYKVRVPQKSLHGAGDHTPAQQHLQSGFELVPMATTTTTAWTLGTWMDVHTVR